MSNEEKEILKDFIYKASTAHPRFIVGYKGNYDSIDDFFNDDSDESYDNNNSITIYIKLPKDSIYVGEPDACRMIELEKLIDKEEYSSKKSKKIYRIAVDFYHKQLNHNNWFELVSILDSKEKCIQITQLILDELEKYQL